MTDAILTRCCREPETGAHDSFRRVSSALAIETIQSGLSAIRPQASRVAAGAVVRGEASVTGNTTPQRRQSDYSVSRRHASRRRPRDRIAL
jgi:hypothetical protein